MKRIKRSFKTVFKMFDAKQKSISLKPNIKAKGNVLLSYGTEVYRRLQRNEGFPVAHSAGWENFHIAKTFLDHGYNVDVIDYTNRHFIPKKDYSFFIDVLSNLERLSPLLNKTCIRIFHPCWAHWSFNNRAEYERLALLLQRKNICLKPKVLIRPNLSIECTNYVTSIGNQFTSNSYSYARKPTFPISHSSNYEFPWPQDKNFDSCRRNFLWLGGFGLVHKGLDLVLDAFSQMQDYHLFVCGPIHKEPEFEMAFHKELYETSNIHTIGWVDLGSSKFAEVMHRCAGLIHPSCSEISAGSVISCLHAGLIAIVSIESDIEVNDDFGLLLKDSSINEIKESVKFISDLPTKQLEQMSRNAWEYARNNYVRQKFLDDYNSAICKIIDNHSQT